jgi:hypothetical protein
LAGQTYTIVSATGTGVVNFTTLFKDLLGATIPNGAQHTEGALTYTVTYNSSSISVNFSTVPEPSGAAVLVLSCSAVMLRRRRTVARNR